MKEWLVIGVLAGLLVASQAWPQSSWRWSSIKQPGAVDTVALGTNDGGWVVGRWDSRTDPDRRGAFRYQKGVFRPFTIPGAVTVLPVSIAAKSLIVGYYTVRCGSCGDESVHVVGFLYEHVGGAKVTELVHPNPDAYWTLPAAVNDAGEVMGAYFTDGEGGLGGGHFLYRHRPGSWEEIETPGEAWVELTGLNNHGDLTGYAAIPVDPSQPTGGLRWVGLVRWQGTWHTLELPGASATLAADLNDLGQVVGRGELPEGTRGWLYDLESGQWQVFAKPGHEASHRFQVLDVDNLGRLVGVESRVSDGYTQSWWLRPIE